MQFRPRNDPFGNFKIAFRKSLGDSSYDVSIFYVVTIHVTRKLEDSSEIHNRYFFTEKRTNCFQSTLCRPEKLPSYRGGKLIFYILENKKSHQPIRFNTVIGLL